MTTSQNVQLAHRLSVLSVLDIINQGKHMIFVFLELAYFSTHHGSQMQPFCYKTQDCILFMAERYFLEYVYYTFFLQAAVDGHLH